MSAILSHAFARLALRRGRAVVAALGIVAASAMLGASVTVAYALATGFDRAAARANLPDAIARFDDAPLEEVEARTQALPNVRRLAYRLEEHGRLRFGDEGDDATLEGVYPGPRGYAVVEGRDVSRDGEAVVERGLQREWQLGLGDEIEVGTWAFGARTLRVVGVAVAPETVAYPLAGAPRVYIDATTIGSLSGKDGRANVALLWAADPDRLDVTLSQARAASFGISDLEFVTQDGIRALVRQAGGLVIALLVAFSIAALGSAGVMLAASASAEVQRRLEAIGVVRALGASRSEVALGHAVEAALVAAPAAALGVFLGWLIVNRPVSRLLEALNQLPPGRTLAALLLAVTVAIVLLVMVAATWPAWRAASRRPVDALRGSDIVTIPRRVPTGGGAFGLGVRLALARPLRTGTIGAVLASSAAVALLMLTIASLLRSLESNPATVGKRYQLEVGAASPADVGRVPGVAAAVPRYEIDAADSFGLSEPFRIVAFPGDHTAWEAPALADGRRLANASEAEIGLGLAQALNVPRGGVIAAQLPSGAELRFRVVGVVRALEYDGRVLYTQPTRLLAAEPSVVRTIAVRISADASADGVRAALERRGFYADGPGGITANVSGWAERNSGFLGILVALLLSVAVLDGVVCLYALVQMLFLLAEERRRAVSVLRAVGAGTSQLVFVFAGAALVVGLVAAPFAVVLERVVVAPAVSRIAASYVSLPLGAGALESAVVVAGLLLGGLASAAWVGRSAARRPLLAGLREE